MLTYYSFDINRALVKNHGKIEEAIWIDLNDPTLEERQLLRDFCNLDLPLHHELYQLEYSNRFYQENDALFLSFSIVTKAAPVPESHYMSIIISKKRLVTLRFSDPNPVQLVAKRAEEHHYNIENPADLLIEIAAQMVGHVADLFELVGSETDNLSIYLIHAVDERYNREAGKKLTITLQEISKIENLLSKNVQSLASLSLMFHFVEHYQAEYATEKNKADLKIIFDDIMNLQKNSDYLNQKIGFQLQSNLGLINIQQTQIIKVFTVLATIFMPPTLIASVYGMNFKHMPELSNTFGYPLAIGLMIVAAILPYQFFKRKGWI